MPAKHSARIWRLTKRGRLGAVLREKTEKQGVDVILDMVGGSYIQKNIDSLNWDGRLSIIAFLTGAKAN